MITGFKTKSIKTMTLGQRLRQVRVRRNCQLTEVEEATKVRLRYLLALEDDDYGSLPAQVYAIGFLERYLDFLHLPKQKYSVDFKRALAAWQSMQRETLSPKRSIKEPKLIITPKLIFSAVASLVVVVMVSYIYLQVHRLTAPPVLTIITPSETTKVAIERVEIAGKTDPGAVVEINNQRINQDKDGNFKQIVELSTGVNTIQVVATNRFQKQSIKTLNVLRTKEISNEKTS